MKSATIKKDIHSKLSHIKGDFNVLHVNTNGGMGGGNFQVIGSVAPTLTALGMVEVILAITKEVVFIHPVWISSIRKTKLYSVPTHFNEYLKYYCELKSHKETQDKQPDMIYGFFEVEAYDSI